MFANNKKVSVRQLNRIIITENIGVISLFSGYLAGVLKNVTYVWVLGVGMLLSMGYMWICLKISNKYGDKLVRSKIFNILTAIRFFVMGSLGIFILYKLTADIMLQETTTIVIVGAISVFCIFMAKCDYEARGRMHEILCIVAIIPIIIILITATFKIDWEYAQAQIMEGFNLVENKYLILLLCFFLSSTYFEKLIIINSHYYNTYGNRIKLLKAPVVLWITAIWVFVVCTCIFGENGSLLRLMDIGGIPGGFLNRQEAIMSLFLVVSFTSYISGMLFYVRQNVKNNLIRYVKTPHIVLRRIVSVILILLMVASAYFLAIKSERNNEIVVNKIIGGTEIEKWDFVMSMSVGKKNDKLAVVMEIPVYIEGKSNSNYVYYEGESLEEISIDYINNGNNKLDFSHIKAVLLTEFNDKKEFISSLESDNRFSGNTTIVNVDLDIDNLYKKLNVSEEDSISLGKTLENLGKNVDDYKDSCLYKAGISMDYIKNVGQNIFINSNVDDTIETDRLGK